MKFTLVMGAMTTARMADAVNLIATEPSWQTVAGGRPLVYGLSYYWNGATAGGSDGGLGGNRPVTAQDITDFRNAVIAAGKPNPYIVCMAFTAASTASQANTYGCDGITTYAVSAGPRTLTSQTWAQLVTATTNLWNAYAATGKPVVPNVTVGFDNRPFDTGGSSYWY